MNNDDELIKRLSFENYIWITFIVVSLIDIYGDELFKRSVTKNDSNAKSKAKNLFLLVALISIIVYVYFFYRNYTDYQKHCNKFYEVRLFGSIFLLVGALCLVYFQLYNPEEIVLPSNI